MGCIVKNEGTVYSDTTGWELLGDGYLVLVETFCNIVQNNFHLKIPRNLLFFSFEISVVLKNTDFCFVCFRFKFVTPRVTRAPQLSAEKCKKLHLTTETVEGTALTFQGVDHIHSSDSLSAGVLGVGDGVTDDGFKEDLEDTTGFFVDESGDAFDTTTSRKTADGGFGNALDVVSQDLAVTFGTTFA
jgi:hypothetical protein